ncbi:MAG: trans-acting enoyl reductase family protein [Haloarculaceae archaeon]
MSDLLVYGAYGYTGDLVARAAVEAGLDPILAGRRERPVSEQARELDLAYRAFPLDVAPRAVDDVAVVVNCAGPFVNTYEPLVEACVETGAHYVDVTGEVDVFEAVRGYDRAAREAGVTLLPGAGFDVVPTDCLANYLHDRLPGATHLTTAIDGLQTLSPGTTRTLVEVIEEGAFVREEGLLTPVPLGERTRSIDFGDGHGERLTTLVPWGDVSTAYHSTGVPNVGVYAPTSRWGRRALAAVDALSPVLGTRPVKATLQRLAGAVVDGPTARERETGTADVWGEVTDGEETARARLVTPEPYAFTARAAVEIAIRVRDGAAPVGYQTPASAHGPGLATDLGASEFEDLA